MEKENKRHVQLPNNMCEDGLTPWHMLVYLSIRRFMNKDYEAYPSLEKISELSGLGVKRIKTLVKGIEEKGYFIVGKRGKSNLYKFNRLKSFEPFSYDFLDNKELTSTEKAYIVASQQYMFKGEEGIGRINYPNRQLAKKINVSEFTIRKCDKSLEEKGYLTLLNDEYRGIENGKRLKEFNLTKLGQAIVWILKEHDDKIKEHSEDISKLTDEVKMLKEEIKRLTEKDKKKFVI